MSGQGQSFASVATIRAAIFDELDNEYAAYEFYLTDATTEDIVAEHRSDFVNNVIGRIAELQAPPHDGIKLENLCPRHRRDALPHPTTAVCVACQRERMPKAICVRCQREFTGSDAVEQLARHAGLEH